MIYEIFNPSDAYTIKEKFLAKRHDKMRSSMNDIGKSAKQYAEAIRKI